MTEISGRIKLKQVVGLFRNGWSRSSEICRCGKTAAGTTIRTKLDGMKTLGRSARAVYDRYQREGIRNSVDSDLGKAKELVNNLPSKAQDVFHEFLTLNRQQQVEEFLKLTITMLIFSGTAGWADLEGGLPDLDLKLGGVGHHRNLVSHTILLGLGVEASLRLILEVMQELCHRLPESHHNTWDIVYNVTARNQNLPVAAVWAGIGLHLLKDANLFAAGTKPYTGIPAHLSMGTHQALFAANGISCEVVAATQRS